jgi:hypothetical protein
VRSRDNYVDKHRLRGNPKAPQAGTMPISAANGIAALMIWARRVRRQRSNPAEWKVFLDVNNEVRFRELVAQACILAL